jgi:hypothetical protein
VRRAALLLVVAMAVACAWASGSKAPAAAPAQKTPYDAAPAAAHAIDVQIDARAAREILESLSRPRLDVQDAKLLEDLPAVRLAIQDSLRTADVFERDFAAAFDENSRTSVFDFRTIRQERDRWRVLLDAVASREKDLVRLATQRAAALLPGDRAVSAKVRVYFSFGLAGLADHLVLASSGGQDIMVVDLARALGEATGEPLDSQISRLARLVAGEAFRQAWAIYRRDSPAWRGSRPQTAPIDLFLHSVAEAGPAALFAVDENFFPLSVWLKAPMKRTVEELNHRAERFARAQENLEARVELTTELRRPDFMRQVAGPSGAFLADAIVQMSGLDALRAALQNGPKAFFQAYAKASQADKSLIPLTHAITERLK